MDYFLDQEFISGFHKPLFGKKRHFIDLISIGIVSSDDREYYAVSNEYNYKDADPWVQDNVIMPAYNYSVSGGQRMHLSERNFNKVIGKSNAQIANEVKYFVLKPYIDMWHNDYIQEAINFTAYLKESEINFYGYYADYDWVLFCSLFGRMIDLPGGFPMYCRDLKEHIDVLSSKILSTGVGTHTSRYKWYPKNFNDALAWVKEHPLYPVQSNEHNALADARWNKALFEFLQKL